MKEMDLVFLGGLFPKEYKAEILQNSIGAVQNAADALQWNYVYGFNKLDIRQFQIINSMYIGSFPKRYKKMIIKTQNFENNENTQNINVGFNNLTGYKIFSRKHSIKKQLKKWALNGKKDKYIIAYALTSVLLDGLVYIKKINPQIKTCIIVPDLPEYMNLSEEKTKLYTTLKAWDKKHIYKAAAKVDAFVLLTEQMNDKLKAKNYVVIEGITTGCFPKKEQQNVMPKSILYAGTLDKKYGIRNLVDAFLKTTDADMRLILCGTGDSESYVKEQAQKDSRILFKGIVAREDVLQLMQRVSLIINPRKNDEEFTKYSFPSKNIEALSSGTPLIAYKLDGIPNDYDEYIYYVKGADIFSLSQTMQAICNKPQAELQAFGKNAKNFVLNHKNNVVQAKKVLDMLEGL